MGFFNRLLIAFAITVSSYVSTTAQSVYYPADASQLLKSTAEDLAMLLQKAQAGSTFNIQPYTNTPGSGIILKYDSSITGNQFCKVQSDGLGKIIFAAAEDNGLNYGVYQYLQNIGYRFYQPGTIWESIPSLSSPYKKIDTIYLCKFKYLGWFISGGHNVWAMDNNNSYYWDKYNGAEGHQWALYMRRNNMTGSNGFGGHRDDILTDEYVATLHNNPCYVAPYNGSRAATRLSVPDVNNTAAMQLWSSEIEKKYTQFKNTIFGNAPVYANYIRNFNTVYGSIGIEVPDGAHFANSIDNGGCGTADYATESDQHFVLANYTATTIGTMYPEKRFQLYAYDGHADIPTSKINISNNIDVQVVPTAFQSETSPKGLLNRWYKLSKNISEYHYLNLPQWSGETPSFYLDDLKTTIERIKEKNSQGIVWEASAAKFASLPFLLAANISLQQNKSIDSALHEFCTANFENGAGTVYTLLQCWGNDKTMTLTNGVLDNKYKLPYYYQLVLQAVIETQQAPVIVQERLNELKAYLHYMQLFYDWAFDQRLPIAKADKAAALCLYLAKINKMQLVNSYFLIQDVVWKYKDTDAIHTRFNPYTGTAYLQGGLAQITAAEINANFAADCAIHNSTVTQFSFQDAVAIKTQFDRCNMEPLEKISVKINYTQGKDYGTKCEYYFIATAAGSFSIKYKPRNDIADKSYINFTVEAINETLGIIKDHSIVNNNAAGILYISVPAAGTYKLSILTKYKTAADIVINTNGNYFYKNGPYLGNTIENYRGDLLSLPGYFYVPENISKIYFSLNNSYSSSDGFATPATVSGLFNFKDNNNHLIEPKVASSGDSALFYLEVPQGSAGSFWQSFKMEQLRLCFSNITNIQWYARRKACTVADFKATIKKIAGECITQLTTSSNSNYLRWEVYDALKWYSFSNTSTIDLPNYISPNAIVTLISNGNCLVTKRIGDDVEYLHQKTSCATGAAPEIASVKLVVYPNPSSGIFKCLQDGEPVLAEEIKICNTAGARMAAFKNTQIFNISQLPAGIYIYSILIKQMIYTGKLIKL
jgi:hypothetical protein